MAHEELKHIEGGTHIIDQATILITDGFADYGGTKHHTQVPSCHLGKNNGQSIVR